MRPRDPNPVPPINPLNPRDPRDSLNPRDPLIAAAELAELLLLAPPARPVILDVRYPGVGLPDDGRAQYLAGHVPGAVYVSLDDALAAPHVPGVTGRHPLPEAAVLQAAMRAAGVNAARPVVVYDDWHSIAAARAWWLLRWAGHDDVRVLDGGWRAWRAGGGTVETGAGAPPEPGDIVVEPGGRAVVDAEGAERIAATGVLLDARPANRYRGEDETIDPVAGHIPGARSLPALSLMADDDRFLPAERLAERFGTVGVRRGAGGRGGGGCGDAGGRGGGGCGDAGGRGGGGRGGGVGIYCGSGLQACHVALAAAACGAAADPAVYAGSWSEWITDPTRPVARGAQPEGEAGGAVIRAANGAAGEGASALEVVTLWRPTGPEEMELVRASGLRRWPPRLAEQPIFYPVLNEQYATKIARDWNVPASGVGYVTRFDVEADYLSQFPVRQAGGRDILEYWIPADRLEEFNDHIVGNIVEVAKFELVDGEVVERRF
mgnify:CR=1 FL=1